MCLFMYMYMVYTCMCLKHVHLYCECTCIIIILQIVLYVLSGHAYHGDLDAIKTTIGIMREQRLFAGHNVFADMLDALSRGGHHEKIVEVININYIIIVYMYMYM